MLTVVVTVTVCLGLLPEGGAGALVVAGETGTSMVEVLPLWVIVETGTRDSKVSVSQGVLSGPGTTGTLELGVVAGVGTGSTPEGLLELLGLRVATGIVDSKVSVSQGVLSAGAELPGPGTTGTLELGVVEAYGTGCAPEGVLELLGLRVATGVVDSKVSVSQGVLSAGAELLGPGTTGTLELGVVELPGPGITGTLELGVVDADGTGCAPEGVLELLGLRVATGVVDSKVSVSQGVLSAGLELAGPEETGTLEDSTGEEPLGAGAEVLTTGVEAGVETAGVETAGAVELGAGIIELEEPEP